MLPLTPGTTYEISYSARLKHAVPSTATSACWIVRYDSVDAREYVGDDGATSSALRDSHSGTGVVTAVAGQSVALGCLSDQPFFTSEIEPVQIIVTPLAGVSTQALTPIAGP